MSKALDSVVSDCSVKIVRVVVNDAPNFTHQKP